MTVPEADCLGKNEVKPGICSGEEAPDGLLMWLSPLCLPTVKAPAASSPEYTLQSVASRV